MDALKLTFKNGETSLFPFGGDSTLTIETPDGVNGVKRGAWGEIAGVEYVKDGGDVTEPVAETPAQPAVETPDAAAQDASLATAPADDKTKPAGA